jgi:CDP-diacylglycerol---glycerol-3-phosphate 3-phosphatidyltransferase
MAGQVDGMQMNRGARREPRITVKQAISPPNLVTYLRIVIIPAVLVVMYFDSRTNAFLAAIIFTVASLTDFVDGYLARRFDMVSVLGKFLDPLADKLLVMGALVMLVHLGRVYAWMVIVILAREIVISSLRSIAATEGYVIAARELGKQKTVFQMVGIWCLLVHYDYRIGFLADPVDFHRLGIFLLLISIVFSVLSAVDYFVGFARSVVAEDRREGA